MRTNDRDWMSKEAIRAEMRSFYRKTQDLDAVCKEFNLSERQVRHVFKNILKMKLPRKKRGGGPTKLTPEVRQAIITDKASGMTNKALAFKYDLHYDTVVKIFREERDLIG